MKYNNLPHSTDSRPLKDVMLILPPEPSRMHAKRKRRYIFIKTTAHSTEQNFTKKIDPLTYSPKRSGHNEFSDSSCYLKLDRKLNNLMTIESDWDGYGSPKPNNQSLVNARIILSIAHKLNNFQTTITPSVEGGIGLVFEGSSKYAVVECYNDGDIAAIGSNRKGETKSWTLAGSDSELQQTIEEIHAYVGK